MPTGSRLPYRALFGALLLLIFAGGCARQPPSQNALSGKRLRVTMLFRGPVDPTNFYYFLINNAGDQNAPGPVPVLIPPYGNGFATGSGGGTNGFTDFVLFTQNQPQSRGGYQLYHVVGDSINRNFRIESGPITFTTPDPNDPRTANQLQFEIDLSQIIVQADGTPLVDQNQAVQQANALKFLQVNIVATDRVPTDPLTPIVKRVDSLGDTTTALGQSSFLTMDVSQNRIIRNADLVGQESHEPDAVDVFGGNNPTLDLIDWSIEVRQQ